MLLFVVFFVVVVELMLIFRIYQLSAGSFKVHLGMLNHQLYRSTLELCWVSWQIR